MKDVLKAIQFMSDEINAWIGRIRAVLAAFAEIGARVAAAEALAPLREAKRLMAPRGERRRQSTARQVHIAYQRAAMSPHSSPERRREWSAKAQLWAGTP